MPGVPPLYAIVRSGGRQEKVAVGDVTETNRVTAEPGDNVVLPALLLVDGGTVTSDAETLAGVTVWFSDPNWMSVRMAVAE